MATHGVTNLGRPPSLFGLGAKENGKKKKKKKTGRSRKRFSPSFGRHMAVPVRRSHALPATAGCAWAFCRVTKSRHKVRRGPLSKQDTRPPSGPARLPRLGATMEESTPAAEAAAVPPPTKGQRHRADLSRAGGRPSALTKRHSGRVAPAQCGRPQRPLCPLAAGEQRSRAPRSFEGHRAHGQRAEGAGGEPPFAASRRPLHGVGTRRLAAPGPIPASERARRLERRRERKQHARTLGLVMLSPHRIIWRHSAQRITPSGECPRGPRNLSVRARNPKPPKSINVVPRGKAVARPRGATTPRRTE